MMTREEAEKELIAMLQEAEGGHSYSMIDQSSVDKSTEQWLDTIESRLHYERWYCGHYHTDKEIDKIRFMFQDYALLPHQISLSAEKEMIRRMQRQAEIVEALGLMDETPKQ